MTSTDHKHKTGEQIRIEHERQKREAALLDLLPNDKAKKLRAIRLAGKRAKERAFK